MNFGKYVFWNDEKELFKNNRDAINEFLFSVVHAATIILLVLMAVMAAISFKFNYAETYKRVYSVFFLASCAFFAFIKIFKRFSKKHAPILVYALFVLFLSFTLAANYSAPKVHEYVSAICAIFIIPLLILDRSVRVNAFVSVFLVVCLWTSYKFKGMEYFKNDAVNLFMYFFAGVAVGKNVRMNRLKGFDTERILTIERNTDSLTKLANRRKLFEFLRLGNESLLTRPTGMFMIDIDNFKKYNDHYGHRAGDICLGIIGKCFADFCERHAMKFFRYGGEEFCGLCWSKDYMELASCAEELLQAVRDLKILFNIDGVSSGIVTISIGYAAFDREADEYNFESMIKVSDAALYSAKSHGRNCARGA